jgi:DNA-binding response OmpR family regulator
VKVLIIEDDLNKVRQLADFMKEAMKGATILERRSFTSGLRAAVSENPDLVLLDMTMPTYDVGGAEKGGRTRALGGRDILSQLSRRQISTQVIVVTQFESFGEEGHSMNLTELNAMLSSKFKDNYVSTCFISPRSPAGARAWARRWRR